MRTHQLVYAAAREKNIRRRKIIKCGKIVQEVKPQTLSHKPLLKYTSGRKAVVVLEDTHCNHDSYSNQEEEIQILISS